MKNEIWKRIRALLLSILITSTVMFILLRLFNTNPIIMIFTGWFGCILNEFLYTTLNKWTVKYIPKDKAKIVEEYIENNKPLR